MEKSVAMSNEMLNRFKKVKPIMALDKVSQISGLAGFK